MDNLDSTLKEPESTRARKRRETLDRIARTGLKLFVENGYEETTLDAIAAASGIARRTFFHYFKSKDDILLAYQDSGFTDMLRSTILAHSLDEAPLEVGRKCLLEISSTYESKEFIVVDKLLRSTEALRTRKEVLFVEMEQVLFEAFRERWPDPMQRDALRVNAMLVVGTLRLAMDDWRSENGERPLSNYIERSFALLKEQF